MEDYINGSDILVEVAGKYTGHATSHSCSYTSETKDRAVKAAHTASSFQALFKEKGVTGLAVSITCEGLQFDGDEEGNMADFRKAWAMGKLVTVSAYRRGSEKPYLKGQFVIDSLEETAPAQDDATYSISLSNSGPVEFDEEIKE